MKREDDIRDMQLREMGRVSVSHRYSREQIIDAMIRSGGTMARLSWILDCTVGELAALVQSDKQLGTIWRDLRKGVVAKAEQCVVNLLSSDDQQVQLKAAKYLLDNLGRREGYGGNTGGVALEVDGGGDKSTRIRAIFGLPGGTSDEDD